MHFPYIYSGEKFQVDDSADCEVKVTNGINTVLITYNNTGSSVYRVSLMGTDTWWALNTPEESVVQACRGLAKYRAKTSNSPEDACKALHEFVEQLSSK